MSHSPTIKKKFLDYGAVAAASSQQLQSHSAQSQLIIKPGAESESQSPDGQQAIKEALQGHLSRAGASWARVTGSYVTREEWEREAAKARTDAETALTNAHTRIVVEPLTRGLGIILTTTPNSDGPSHLRSSHSGQWHWRRGGGVTYVPVHSGDAPFTTSDRLTPLSRPQSDAWSSGGTSKPRTPSPLRNEFLSQPPNTGNNYASRSQWSGPQARGRQQWR